jgi:hypothetical protein
VRHKETSGGRLHLLIHATCSRSTTLLLLLLLLRAVKVGRTKGPR